MIFEDFGRATMTVVGLVLGLGLVGPADARSQIVEGARTFYVPSCPGSGPCTAFGSIPAAVAAAADGDTIVVSETGTYPAIDFAGKNVTIASSWILSGDPADIADTIIYGGAQLRNGEDTSAVLVGFTIRGAVSVRMSGGTLDHVVIDATGIPYAAVTVYLGEVAIYDSTITSGSGEGIHSYMSTVDLQNTRVEHHGAAGIDLYVSQLSVSGGSISDNAGPGIDGYATPTWIEGAAIRDNGESGVHLHHGSDLLMEGCEVTGNHSSSKGGGLWVDLGSALTVRDTLIANNTADRDGGGILTSGSQVSHQPVIERVRFVNNVAAKLGGGLYVVYGSPRVRDSVFAANTALQGGGIAVNAVDGQGTNFEVETRGMMLQNVTIVGNLATYPGGYIGGGLADIYGSVVTVKNSILWGNAPVQGSTYHGSLRVDWSDVQDGRDGLTEVFDPDQAEIVYGAHNIERDPELRASGGGGQPVGVAYHLSSGSPCIDSGRTEAAMGDQRDIDGQPRLMGVAVDIGADEALPAIEP